jgi:hypothetical protein
MYLAIGADLCLAPLPTLLDAGKFSQLDILARWELCDPSQLVIKVELLGRFAGGVGRAARAASPKGAPHRPPAGGTIGGIRKDKTADLWQRQLARRS